MLKIGDRLVVQVDYPSVLSNRRVRWCKGSIAQPFAKRWESGLDGVEKRVVFVDRCQKK